MTETSAEDDDDDADGVGGQVSGAHAGTSRRRRAAPASGGSGLDRLIVPDEGTTMLRARARPSRPKAAKGGHHHARGPTLTAIDGEELARRTPTLGTDRPGVGGDALGLRLVRRARADLSGLRLDEEGTTLETPSRGWATGRRRSDG